MGDLHVSLYFEFVTNMSFLLEAEGKYTQKCKDILTGVKIALKKVK